MSREREGLGRFPQARPGPAGGLRDANRRARTAELLRAAVGLFLARGVEAVTIDEIAQAAGMAKGSFYTYFHDKADLVATLLAPVRSRLVEALVRCEGRLRAARSTEGLREAYLALAAELVEVVFDQPEVSRMYLQECRGPGVGARVPVGELAEEIRSRSGALTEAARSSGLLRDLDVRVTAAAVVGAAEHLVFRALSGDDFGAPGAALGALVSMVVEGLAASEAPLPGSA